MYKIPLPRYDRCAASFLLSLNVSLSLSVCLSLSISLNGFPLKSPWEKRVAIYYTSIIRRYLSYYCAVHEKLLLDSALFLSLSLSLSLKHKGTHTRSGNGARIIHQRIIYTSIFRARPPRYILIASFASRCVNVTHWPSHHCVIDVSTMRRRRERRARQRGTTAMP